LLQEFSGTLFLVSHDRAFLENTVTQVIAFEGNGVLTEFGGGYDDWQRFSTLKAQQRLEDKKSESAHAAKVASKQSPAKPASKLSFKEQKELEEIPAKIELLETEQANISSQLADGELYKTQPERVNTLRTRLSEIESLIETLLSRWETLDSK